MNNEWLLTCWAVALVLFLAHFHELDWDAPFNGSAHLKEQYLSVLNRICLVQVLSGDNYQFYLV